MTEVIIKLKKITITGQLVMWNETDPGFINYAGSVYFTNSNYFGYMNHDGAVKLYRQSKLLGNYTPENFVYA